MEIQIFRLVIDLTPLMEASQEGLWPTLWYIFINGGWIFIALVFIVQGYFIWLFSQQNKWFLTNKYILLAVDVPKDTEQTPKAVEQLFSTLSGAHGELSKYEKWIKGMFQLHFSFEIVGLDGYVQFLIYTPSQFKDLVESSIYSQYPDAEVTEVEDYVTTAPNKFPDDTYNMWGTEITLAAPDVYPIRTYPLFEDKVSGEYKDPVASILETMSKIQVGEQVWLQLLIVPTGFEWVKKAQEVASKLAGKYRPRQIKTLGLSGGLTGGLGTFLNSLVDIIYPVTHEPSNKKEDMPSMMLHLTPGERARLDAVENKASKMGFQCKMRLIYLSPHEQYSAARVVSSVFGSIKQFAELNLNSFKPDKRSKTSVAYFAKYRLPGRRTRLINAYKHRSTMVGRSTYLLNTEELASIWHFPSKYVISPSLRRTAAKRMAPPSTLPLQIESKDEEAEQLKKQLQNKEYKFDLTNDYFENRFAKTDKKPQLAGGKGKPPSNLPTSE